MNIWVVRHGETEANAAHRMSGHIDTPLTKKGHAHASSVSCYLRMLGVKPAMFITSDLGRTIRTAMLIKDGFHAEWDELGYNAQQIYPHASLRELSYGDYEWKLRSEVEVLMPNYYTLNTKFPNGECFTDMQKRVMDHIKFRAEYHCEDKDLLVVCHAGVIRAIQDHYGQHSIKDGRHRIISHTSMMRLEYDCEKTGTNLRSYREYEDGKLVSSSYFVGKGSE